MPLAGGEIERFGDFLQGVLIQRPCGLEQEDLRSLVTNYGSAYPDVLRRFQPAAGGSPDWDGRRALLRAQVLYAVEEEMAQTLSDVVFRRTELGTAAYPGQEALEFCARVMAERLGWSPAGLRREVDEVNRTYQLEAE
jgi:glycerol-3-phosphate dehydrogenase